jgi:hypothetical protein
VIPVTECRRGEENVKRRKQDPGRCPRVDQSKVSYTGEELLNYDKIRAGA